MSDFQDIFFFFLLGIANKNLLNKNLEYKYFPGKTMACLQLDSKDYPFKQTIKNVLRPEVN